jgi:hypothetical protein
MKEFALRLADTALLDIHAAYLRTRASLAR